MNQEIKAPQERKELPTVLLFSLHNFAYISTIYTKPIKGIKANCYLYGVSPIDFSISSAAQHNPTVTYIPSGF